MLNLLLPEHITIEILLKLPFESILSCKLVSKQLKNLINDPKFYKRYNNKSVALYLCRNGVYCLLINHPKRHITQQVPPYTVHRIPMFGVDSSDELLSGSSNTIACVKSHFRCDYRFYNLFTGASYTLKSCTLQQEYRPVWIGYGFGYDRHTDDYNILEVTTFHMDMDMDTDRDVFWVYSFKNRGWKSFRGYPYDLYNQPIGKSTCSFNGVLHWVVVTRDIEVPKHVILTYDLHGCKFGEILLPIEGSIVGPSDELSTAKVSELDGRLCYVYQKYVNFRVWVMKEYGVRESWTKLLVFDSKVGWSFIGATPTLLYERRDGGKVVLFAESSPLIWYDIDTQLALKPYVQNIF